MRELKITQLITNRTSDNLDKYLNDVSRIGLIPMDEEVVLAIKIKNGDKAALDKLVKTNLRFVVSVAKKYQNQGLSLSDLICEGNLGLIKAAERFDHTKGFKFISFAVWWIRQSIMFALAEQRRLVRLPGNQIVGINKVNKAKELLEQKLERVPTITEIAFEANVTVDKVTDYLYSAPHAVSLDMLTNEETGFTLLDSLPDEGAPYTDHQMMRQSLSYDLQRMMNILSPREKRILCMFYGLEGHNTLTLEDIATSVRLSKERVGQIKNDAIRRLRSCVTKEMFADYM
jgi:RNA polymerase primary sigma factor